MKLFLSSNFYQVSDLLLPILPKKPCELTIAFIPTAADPYKNKPWMYEDRNKLIEMGFSVVDLDIKNKTKEQLVGLTKDIDIIFVSGGSTCYLLQHVQESGFDEVTKNMVAKDVIYIGSSAGSVLTCPTIEYIKDLDDKSNVDLNSYKGIGLVNFLILPHYDDVKYIIQYQKIMKKWKNKKYEIRPLKNNQSLIINNDTVKVMETHIK